MNENVMRQTGKNKNKNKLSLPNKLNIDYKKWEEMQSEEI